MSPASLIQMASESGPPRVPRSFILAIAPPIGMVGLIARQIGVANDLAAVIGTLPEINGATQISKICHDAVIPEERIEGWHAQSWGSACSSCRSFLQ